MFHLVGALSLIGLATNPRRVHVVVNPASGGRAGLAILERIMPTFAVKGIEVVPLETEYAGHAEELARSTPLLDAFCAIGGDGTAHEIANGMLSRDVADRVPIGIIPGGSGNTWAFDLGFEQAEDAAEAIAAGSARMVDVQEVRDSDGNERFSINMVGYGLPSTVLKEANELRWLGGGAQYELAGLSLILQGKTSHTATLEIEAADGTTTSREVDGWSFVQSQINRCMGSRVPFCPNALMDDGLIDLCLVKSGNGLAVIATNLLAKEGAHTELPFVEMLQCRSYCLRPSPTEGLSGSASVNLDGELSGGSPFTVTCRPRALAVLAAQGASGSFVSPSTEPSILSS